ncbi:hypothetical protein O9H85_32705 [Paenibacillus filicis]|uniref:Uncharacterized protein n=1 Tax=Paenibacillus gyeongsangnamensis TaxID=3388067 RepID=A0ABT4QJJ9_9BACL|nr:hypothetical protein [Paenibacillus filicis]MCZ8517035.1 hypothetical protein [Paenibacillus filicis]
MKRWFSSTMNWDPFVQKCDTYLAAKVLKWKKRLNPLTNRIGYGIYFYKNITINLNRLNKELLEIAEDYVSLPHHKKTSFPTFISVADGINPTPFSKLPNYVVRRITMLVSELPGFKVLQSNLKSYGYTCKIHYNQGRIFFGSLQIYFEKNQYAPGIV